MQFLYKYPYRVYNVVRKRIFRRGKVKINLTDRANEELKKVQEEKDKPVRVYVAGHG